MKLFELNGDIAFVTGAGSGIGQSIALGMAEAGADVALFGRDSKASGLAETARKITAMGRRALVVSGSVTEKDDIDRAIDRVEAELGPITVAVNNAGVAFAEKAENLTLEQWHRLYDVNVVGVFLSCQAEGRVMLPRGKGTIINIASISGTIVNRGINQVHYNSSKSAVIQMSKSLAMEWADRGIRVNVISPGYTRTPMNIRPEVADQMKIFEGDTPMQRSASPDEMIGPAVFLASQASSFVTGIDLIVDGGFIVW
ncbi:SDR family oxidoreductase [Mesorhizobium sp. YR577]|uniref:SDR family oxidoreductase n=1 Tax=Mesorhizobium sp. YR577 TaxID=1884373 RepID=UPI0008EE9A16|nr:SDR family oxidoreductase [Mesorhizobium sp. YR577]SFU10629.1 NAD(P)-dependent dehydrogenase, short-chain alcohol dehydrogenase family [Mesorhizobium sp. YR577]